MPLWFYVFVNAYSLGKCCQLKGYWEGNQKQNFCNSSTDKVEVSLIVGY